MAEEVSFIIRAKNLVKKGVDGAISTLGRLKGAGAKIGNALGKGLKVGVGAGITALVISLGILRKALDAAFKFERFETQFKVLLGSVDAAKKRIKELSDFASKTPFQIGDIATASRQITLFTEGVLGGADSLKLVGDAAAGVGQPIQEVSLWFGRAFAAIKGGRPFGEAAARLQEMAILTSKSRAKMEQLQKTGASAADVFAVLQGDLEKFSGGMKEASETGEGLVSTLKDNLEVTLAEVGSEFADLAKDSIRLAIQAMKDFRETGLKEWASNTVGNIKAVGTAFGILKEQGTDSIKFFKDIGEGFKEAAGEGGGGIFGFLKKVAKDQTEQLKQARKQLLEGDIVGGIAGLIKGNIPGAPTLGGIVGGAQEQGEQDRFERARKGAAELLDREKRIAALKKKSADEAKNEEEEKKKLAEKIRQDLLGAEKERVKVSIDQIKKLMATDKFAVQAMIEARKKGLKGLSATPTAATAEELLKFVKKESEKLRKAEDAKQERLAKGRSALKDRLEEFRLEQLPEQKQVEARQQRAQDLEKRITGERDPERRLQLQGKLLDEQGSIRSLIESIASGQLQQEERKARAVSVGEAFDIARGDITQEDPQEKQVELQKKMVELLTRLNQNGGLI